MSTICPYVSTHKHLLNERVDICCNIHTVSKFPTLPQTCLYYHEINTGSLERGQTVVQLLPQSLKEGFKNLSPGYPSYLLNFKADMYRVRGYNFIVKVADI